MKLTTKSLWLMLALLASEAGAQTYTVLKHFHAYINGQGMNPIGTLVQAPNGTLFGAAANGGSGAAGVVFRVQTNETGFTIIRSFPMIDSVDGPNGTNTDGSTPAGGLVLSGSTLYGVTAIGGPGGSGTVFSMDTNGGNFTVLKYFTPRDPFTYTNTDGCSPGVGLILSNGVLYGTTQFGGFADYGTIFRVSTNGTGFTNLYNFTAGSDGANPVGRLLLSGNTLYGTSTGGGDFGWGTAFRVSTNGTGFVTLHSFAGSGTDGSFPAGSLLMVAGQLYGATAQGDDGSGLDNGTVFRMSAVDGSSFTNLFSFSGTNGWNAAGDLLLSGSTIYGTTAAGGFIGVPTYFGTVFQINTDGSGFASICSLSGLNGWGPQGGVVLSGGVLYGTTYSGGLLPTAFAYANGTVFSVNVNGTGLTDICTFTQFSGASGPRAGLTLSGNLLLGTALSGGSNSDGSVFEIGTNGSGYAQVYDFTRTDNNGDNPDGSNPRAVMVLSGGALYGTTRYGGTEGWGTIFKLNANGTGFANVYSFPSTNAESPITALAVSGSTLYGMGGGGSFGAVFRIDTSGNGLTNIYNFNGTDGYLPTAGLVLSGSTLYGTTQNGGTGSGNIFQVNTDGSHFTNLYSFTGGNDGANPGTVLVLLNNVLYGTAYHGGSGGQGTVFKINTDQSGFTVLHSFTGTSPNGAGAGDLLLSGGTLYGTTAYDGSSNAGTIFQLDVASTNFTVLKDLTGGIDGANPNSTLVLAGNTLYGTTQNGGLAGQGTVFSLALSSVVVPIPLHIRPIADAVELSWSNPAFSLQASTLVTGTYTNVPGATSPYTNTFGTPTKFFRLQAN